jgi:hypothetical protein
MEQVFQLFFVANERLLPACHAAGVVIALINSFSLFWIAYTCAWVVTIPVCQDKIAVSQSENGFLMRSPAICATRLNGLVNNSACQLHCHVKIRCLPDILGAKRDNSLGLAGSVTAAPYDYRKVLELTLIAHPLQYFRSIHLRHDEVQQQQIWKREFGSVLEPVLSFQIRDDFRPIVDLDNVHNTINALEGELEKLAIVRIVLRQ